VSNDADDPAIPDEPEDHPERDPNVGLDDDLDDGPEGTDSDRKASRRERENDRLADRIAHQFAQQWSLLRTERRSVPEPIRTGPSNFTRAQVPWGVDLAAAWSWRVIVIAAAAWGLWAALTFLAVITLPLVIALLLAALASPGIRIAHEIGIPRGVAAFVVVVGGLAGVSLLFTFVGQQVAQGSTDLADQVVAGLGEIKNWLRDGPLHASDSQINDWIDEASKGIKKLGEGDVIGKVTEVGTALSHVFAGLFIVLFATYFFLADGHRIWAWCVRLAPRAARERVDSSGRVAWISLTRFVRATVIVALTDAIGVMVAAAILGVPLIAAIGVVVFLGAFIPMLGALVAGTVAVLVALVAKGPLVALFMMIGVIIVQQFESHVLQPFLMGRWVSVHPLGVILSIGVGVLVAGIAGALIAVPLAAALNAVVQHLASFTAVGDDAEELLDEELHHG
jgi:predicted PurR-regulated permease PerM